MRKSIVFLAALSAWFTLVGSALGDQPQGQQAQPATPDLVERYVASGRGQADLVERYVASGRGQADLVERWVDGRVGRTGLASTSEVTTSGGDGLSWMRVGAGALMGLVLTLAAAGGLLYLRRRDRRTHAPRPAV